MNEGQNLIALHSARGLISSAIRWQTRSGFSHASLYRHGAGVVESREGHGVRAMDKLELGDNETIELFRVVGVDYAQEKAAWEFAQAQIGKPYDWTMVLRFVSRRQESRASSGKWFCSELVYAAYRHAGIDLLRDTEPWEVSPGLLGKSPLLEKFATLNN